MTTPNYRKWTRADRRQHALGYKIGMKRNHSKAFVKAMNARARLGYLEAQIDKLKESCDAS